MKTDRDVRARPGAVLTVGATALVSGTSIGAISHGVTAYFKQICVVADAAGSESMCGLGVIVWGPAVVVASVLLAWIAFAGGARLSRR